MPAYVETFPVVPLISQTISKPASATNTFPVPSTAIPIMSANLAVFPAPPLQPALAPPPAIVVMIWVAPSTRRTAPLKVSVMNRSPLPSTATPVGKFSRALVAGPLSPPNAPLKGSSLPATVVMFPVVSTRRIRLLFVSAMKTLLFLSTARP